MPIYEYRCESCAHELEKLQRMSDDKLVDCPACGEPALKRLVSAAAFRLKGSGWYETDFKKDNKRNLADSPSESVKKDGADAPADKSSAAANGDKQGSLKKAADKTPATKKPASGSASTAGKANTA